MRPIDADALALETKRWFVIPDDRKTMKDAIDHAETLDYVTKQQWISVKDVLPDVGKRVLVTVRYRADVSDSKERCVCIDVWRGNEDGWLQNGSYDHVFEISHWMPLPEPPKEE